MKKYSTLLYSALTAAILTITLSCSSVNNAVPTFMEKADVLKITGKNDYPDKNEYPDADGVILYDKYDCEIVAQQTLATFTKRSRMVKIFKNVDRFSKLEIRLNVDEKLIGFIARVISPDGIVHTITKEDVTETTKNIQGSEDTYVIRTVIFPELKENSIIEWIYTIQSNNDIYGTTVYLQEYNLPKLYAEYNLIAPKEMNITETHYSYYGAYDVFRYKKLNYVYQISLNDIDAQPDPARFQNNSNYILQWKFNDVPAFTDEVQMPPLSYFVAKLSFRLEEGEGWQSLAKFFNYFYKKCTLSDETAVQECSDSLSNNCKTETEKIIALKNFVQHLKYENIELGDRSLQPRKPKEVIEKGFGDCQDKSTLLVALLKSQKIKAFPAVLITADRGFINPKFPGWRFNHMIVCVEDQDKKTHWIDPSVKYCKLDDIPWYDEGVQAMVLYDNDQYEFKSTPISDYFQNKTEINENVRVLNEDSVKYTLNIIFHGEEDMSMRNKFYDQNEEEKYKILKSFLRDEFANVKIENVSLTESKDLDKTYSISFDFISTTSFSKQGNLYLMNFDAVAEDYDYKLLNDKERKYPIFNTFQLSTHKDIEIDLPDKEYTLNTLPEDLMLNDDNYKFSKLFFEESPVKITITKDFASKQVSIKSSDYPKVKDFLTKIVNSDKDQIIFKKQ